MWGRGTVCRACLSAVLEAPQGPVVTLECRGGGQTSRSDSWNIPVLHKYVERCSAILHGWFFSAVLCCRAFVAPPPAFKTFWGWGGPLDSSKGTYLAESELSLLFFFTTSCVILTVCRGSLLCWKMSLLPRFLTLRVIIFQFSIQINIHGAVCKCHLPGTFFHSVSPKLALSSPYVSGLAPCSQCGQPGP